MLAGCCRLLRLWFSAPLSVSPFGNKCVKKQNGSSLHAEQRVGPESRARESSRRSLLCIFPLEEGALIYTAPHFCTYIIYTCTREEHAFIFYSGDGKKEAEISSLSSRIQLSAMHTHTHHPHPPTHLPHRPLIFIYTGCERGKEPPSLCAERRRARDTHTRAKSMLPSFAQTHTTQGSWFLARSTNSLDAIFFTELAWRGLDKHNKAEGKIFCQIS